MFFQKKKLVLVVPNYKNPLARNEKLSGGWVSCHNRMFGFLLKIACLGSKHQVWPVLMLDQMINGKHVTDPGAQLAVCIQRTHATMYWSISRSHTLKSAHDFTMNVRKTVRAGIQFGVHGCISPPSSLALWLIWFWCSVIHPSFHNFFCDNRLILN
jgi:hypothetical protein